MDGFHGRLARFVQRRRWWVLAAYALLTAALGWLGAHIELKADITDLLPEGTPSGDDLRFYLEKFGNTHPLFLTVTATEGADADALEEAAQRLTDELTATGLFRGVRYGHTAEEGLALQHRLMHHLPVLVPPERIGDLRERLTPASVRSALERLKADAEGPLMAGPRKELVARDPLGLLALLPSPIPTLGPARPDPVTGLFLSPGGDSLLVLATPVTPPQDVAFSRRLLREVESIERRVERAWPGHVIDHAGGHLFAVQDEARIRHDITWTVMIAVAAIAALFTIVLRRIGLLVILMVPLTVSTLWTLGVASIYPGHLNVVTIAFAAILLGMGDDSLTHLYLRFHEELGAGRARADALTVAASSTGPSILLATLTSGLAFGALAFVQFRGLSELGVIAAIGLINLLVSVFFLFPCLLSFGPAHGSASASLAVPMGPFVRFHRWGARRRGLVLSFAAALTLVAAACCLRLEFSSDIRALRGDDPAQLKLDRLLAPFGGLPDPIHLMKEADGVEGALQGVEALAPLCHELQRQGLIAGFSTVTDWLPSNRTQRARFDLSSRMPWGEAAASLTRAAEDLGMNADFFAPFLTNLERYRRWENAHLDPGDGLSIAGLDGISVDPAANVAVVALHPAPGVPPEQIVARLRRLEPAADLRAASVGLVVADLSMLIEHDFLLASFIALATVTLTSLIAFGSAAKLALLAAPVVIGCLLMLGGLALLGVPINLMNLVATPLIFGLGIDFGVYIVNRHEEQGRVDVERLLRHTGGAILLTGVTTLAGFGSLLSASFAGLRSMGWVAVLGIGGCLAASLLILPLLLPSRAE